MAKLKEMTFQKDVKLSHDYNSVGITFGVTMEVEEGENTDELKINSWAAIDKEMEIQVVDAKKVLGMPQ